MERAFATKCYYGKGDGGADSIEESLEVYTDNNENENNNAAVDAIIVGTAVDAGNWDIPERVLIAYRHGIGAGGTSSVPDRGRTQYSNDNAAVDAIIEDTAVDVEIKAVCDFGREIAQANWLNDLDFDSSTNGPMILQIIRVQSSMKAPDQRYVENSINATRAIIWKGLLYISILLATARLW